MFSNTNNSGIFCICFNFDIDNINSFLYDLYYNWNNFVIDDNVHCCSDVFVITD